MKLTNCFLIMYFNSLFLLNKTKMDQQREIDWRFFTFISSIQNLWLLISSFKTFYCLEPTIFTHTKTFIQLCLKKISLLKKSKLDNKIFDNAKKSSCQFHQHFMCKFFVRMLFWQLFSSYMNVEKAAKTTFIQKMYKQNVNEIDYSYQSAR